jgi:hypothetical protein
MSIYNNIKLTSPPVRLNDESTVPSLDSGSAEQVATMAPIMGSFRGILKNNVGGTYQSFKITPPRTTSTIAGPPSYPYNTLHVKGIVLKEQTSYSGAGGTLTTGFEYWTAITNPYFPLASINVPLTSPSSFDENTIIFPSIGANNLHPLPVNNASFANNSPIQSVNATWVTDHIRFSFQGNSNLESNEPFFIKGQYLLL